MLSGELCIREVAAYLLDKDQNFSGVPYTTFVEIVHHSLKYEPFSGLEVTDENYLNIMSSIIRPITNEEIDEDEKEQQ